MSPTSKRTGKRYAAGSHMARGDFPRNCHGCGKPTKLNDCWQETVLPSGERRAWHHACRLAA